MPSSERVGAISRVLDRNRGEEGLSLIEVLIALLVFALVLVGLTSSIIFTTGASLSVSERDQATVTAYNALALATAESCGEVVTGASGRSGCYDQTTWSAPIPASAQSLVASASVVTDWACSTKPSGSPAATAVCSWTSATVPNSIERTVTVTWPPSLPASVRHTLTITSYSPIPSVDLSSQAGANGYVPGGIVECGLSPYASIPLTSTTPAVTVTGTANGQGNAWFPYLPPTPSSSSGYSLGSTSGIHVESGVLTLLSC